MFDLIDNADSRDLYTRFKQTQYFCHMEVYGNLHLRHFVILRRKFRGTYQNLITLF